MCMQNVTPASSTDSTPFPSRSKLQNMRCTCLTHGDALQSTESAPRPSARHLIQVLGAKLTNHRSHTNGVEMAKMAEVLHVVKNLLRHGCRHLGMPGGALEFSSQNPSVASPLSVRNPGVLEDVLRVASEPRGQSCEEHEKRSASLLRLGGLRDTS